MWNVRELAGVPQSSKLLEAYSRVIEKSIRWIVSFFIFWHLITLLGLFSGQAAPIKIPAIRQPFRSGETSPLTPLIRRYSTVPQPPLSALWHSFRDASGRNGPKSLSFHSSLFLPPL
jgi:hypothetical protein